MDHRSAKVAVPRVQTDEKEAELVVSGLYLHFLKRIPSAGELDHWKSTALSGIATSDLIRRFSECDEYKQLAVTAPHFAPGHFHSPIVKPDAEIDEYMRAQMQRVGERPGGIDLKIDSMKSFLQANASFMAAASLSETPVAHARYHQNGPFPLADAYVLRAMINVLRPRRIIEVGSGFSTACMLDTADELGLDVDLTCIEPYPSRLQSLLRPGDALKLLESPVQDVDVRLFADLEANDILFIDSTHVLKTGSDVHYELFEILPSLAPGVVVHFHDCIYPFEYHHDWVFKQNFSWNEVYAVRAFLMYNDTFVPYYWHSLLAKRHPELVRRLLPNSPVDPGGSLWMKKVK